MPFIYGLFPNDRACHCRLNLIELWQNKDQEMGVAGLYNTELVMTHGPCSADYKVIEHNIITIWDH